MTIFSILGDTSRCLGAFARSRSSVFGPAL